MKKKLIVIGIGLLPHVLCCVLPCLLFLLNLLLGTSFAFKLEILNHALADVLLWISGIFIAVSYFLKKDSKHERIILYISTGMFAFSLIAHYAI